MPICTASSSRTGKPCKRAAIPGGTVCPTHGGSAPQVKAAAKLRLLAMVDPALAVLARLVKQGNLVQDAVALKAATEILDRVDLDIENKAEAHKGAITIRFVDGIQED